MPRTRTVDLRWNTLLNDFRRSGLTQAEFCRRREIPLHSFRYHLYPPHLGKPAPREAHSADGADNHFLPVTILPESIPIVATSQSHIELVLPNGRRIAVAPGFDPSTLRCLIAVAEERPCLD
jgi:hypothetical protein